MRFLHALQVLFSGLGRWYFKLRCVGRENIPPTGAVIVASNHLHLSDPIMHAFSLPRTFHTMAKMELFRFKPFGWLIRQLGAFPVDRGHGDRGAIKTAAAVLESGEPLLIFSEGTRSRTGELGPFKAGTAMIASLTGAPIVPAVIYAPRGVGFRRGVVIEYGKPLQMTELGVSKVTGEALRAATKELRDKVEEMQTAWKQSGSTRA